MPRFLASPTANLARSSCSGERYLGFRRLPHPMFTTYTPSARAWSRSETILARVISPPLVNQRMAPYSRGGVLKFAAASRTGGTVICCHGLCAIKVNEGSNAIASLRVTLMDKPPLRDTTAETRPAFARPGSVPRLGQFAAGHQQRTGPIVELG